MSQVGSQRNWEWTIWDTIKRSVAQQLNIGDPEILGRYKDDWVRSHKSQIEAAAEGNGLPVILLAGVCWIEVGGDPDMMDSLAFHVRSFDHMADPLLEPLTVTRKPETTSMGDVSIQLRRAAEDSGSAWDKLSGAEQERILQCLRDEPCNIGVVARHLARLRKIDFGDRAVPLNRLIEITGTRYNRGPDLSLEAIERDTKYGSFILKMANRIGKLLSP